jgi:hypothetical protein
MSINKALLTSNFSVRTRFSIQQENAALGQTELNTNVPRHPPPPPSQTAKKPQASASVLKDNTAASTRPGIRLSLVSFSVSVFCLACLCLSVCASSKRFSRKERRGDAVADKHAAPTADWSSSQTTNPCMCVSALHSSRNVELVLSLYLSLSHTLHFSLYISLTHFISL